MRIDIDQVLRERTPRYHKFIPRFIIKALEKTICQDGLNELLQNNAHLRGADFSEGVVSDLGITYEIRGKVNAENRRVVLVSNHPLGGLDGMVLSAVVKKLYGDGNMKFVVNDLLTFVEPLRDIFIGINKHGAQSRSLSGALDEAFAGDDPIVMFPAGLVSRMRDDGSISDLDWQKMVVNKAISHGRDVIPVHFSGENSQFFYKFARLRTRLGLKFNIEMVRLPREIFFQRGKHFTITLGKPVSHTTLQGGRKAQQQAAELRKAVYHLKP